MIQHFADEQVADAIIQRKRDHEDLAKTEIRDHPNLPGYC